MNSSETEEAATRHQFDPSFMVGAKRESPAAFPKAWLMGTALCASLLGIAYFDALAKMAQVWTDDENYGYGFFVPVISLFLVWIRREQILALPRQGSWWGIPIVLLAMGLYGLGEFGTIYTLLQLSFWLILVGLVLSVFGWDILKMISFPLFYLLSMIPLPQFLFQGLSSQLQLISSALGVGCLQLVGIVALREGNVIDLGPIQLQVVEACSGLRYLFPLMSLALLCAYLFRASLWKRIVVFLSSMPIAILLNGFRIGLVGLLVEVFGAGAAEGFLHFFEGWVIFVLSLAILLMVMVVLSRIGPVAPRLSLSEMLAIPNDQVPVLRRTDRMSPNEGWATPAPMLCAIGLLVVLTGASPFMISREEVLPARPTFLTFPMQVDEWQGMTFPLDRQYIEALRFDDYLLADYHRERGEVVNFYVAYYQSQRKGQAVHSPRTCIPGGGWEITSMRITELPSKGLGGVGTPLSINRVTIQKGDAKQIVYYWFKQRDRWITNEYLVKWFLFWDSMTRRRSDGALVRLASAVHAGESDAAVDQRLQALAGLVMPLLSRYVPD